VNLNKVVHEFFSTLEQSKQEKTATNTKVAKASNVAQNLNYRHNQTHFGSCWLTRFSKNVLGTFLLFVRRETKLFHVKFRHILEIFGLQGFLKMFWANFPYFLHPET